MDQIIGTSAPSPKRLLAYGQFATEGLRPILSNPKHGGIEAHEAWASDLASHERAHTAQETLERVTVITES
ncbi:hypothetical protein PKCBPO_03322 [Methylorubrum thiocyanatum]